MGAWKDLIPHATTLADDTEVLLLTDTPLKTTVGDIITYAFSLTRVYVPFHFPGLVSVGDKHAYFKALVDVAVLGIHVDRIDGLDGQALQGKVVDEADVELVAAQDIVAADALYGQLTFEAPLSLVAGDEILLEITQVGLTVPTEALSGSWITQPLVLGT